RECKAGRVPLIVAREAIEAWMLTDGGICKWLEVPSRPRTNVLGNPKDIMSRAFLRKTGRPYRKRRARVEVAQHATGPNRTANPSLDDAIVHLEDCGVLDKGSLRTTMKTNS